MARRTHAVARPPPAPVAPTFDTLLERLKQSTALELEFVKQLKDGLEIVAAGLQTESYNRSDSLPELRKMLGEERAKLDPATTANRKANIAMALHAELEACNTANAANEARARAAQTAIQAAFEREANYVMQSHTRHVEGSHRLIVFLEALVTQVPGARGAAAQMYDEDGERTKTHVKTMNDEAVVITKRRDDRMQEAKEVYEETGKRLWSQKECLMQVAKMVGVQLQVHEI